MNGKRGTFSVPGMMRVGRAAIGLAAMLTALAGCDYARMDDQESVRTHERAFPRMVEGAIPVQGGLQTLREADPETLRNPLARTAGVIERGRLAYGHFCVMCHGPKGRGLGTVGQSFSPLPTSLVDPYVQERSDGELFYTITFGMNRMPPLGHTASDADRWAVIHYLRSLAETHRS